MDGNFSVIKMYLHSNVSNVPSSELETAEFVSPVPSSSYTNKWVNVLTCGS
jgi:hypothetical protein